MPGEGETKPRKPPAPKVSDPPEKTVALKDFNATLRKLIEETPRKQLYRIKGVLADSWETIELVTLAHVLRHLLKVAPEKLLERIMAREIEPIQFHAPFRKVRDLITATRDACLDLAETAKVELRAWSELSDPGERAPSPPKPPPVSTESKLKTAG